MAPAQGTICHGSSDLRPEPTPCHGRHNHVKPMTRSDLDMIAIDLDGTLVDTIGDIHAAVVRMQDELGMPPSTDAEVRDWIGNGMENLVHRALTGSMDGEAPAPLFERALPRFIAASDALNGTTATLYPGVEAALDALAASGVPLVCVTNKSGRFSRPLLASLGIADRFVHHIAGDDVPAKKPDPAALLEAARRCAASPARSLMVGDSVSDIRAARTAGLAVIAVSYGYNHGQSVRGLRGSLRPDAVIDRFGDLPATIRALGAGGHDAAV